MRRRTVAGTAAVLLVAAGSAAAVTVVRSRDDATSAAETTVAQLSTTEVQQQDVVTYDETTATLGFTTSVTVSSPVAGTVTSVLGEGDTVDAGAVVATIDGDPVVAMIGDVPGWRDLTIDSSDGVDVRQLETNLVALGFDPDGAIVIDETFDDATEAAVTLWEESLGLDGDGEVPQGRVVFVPGVLLVDTVDVGVGGAASSGASLLTARQTERRFVVTTPGASLVSDLAAAGTPVVTGTVLFRNDHLPVVAVEGDVSSVPALSRELSVGVDEGSDVRLLEQMLQAGGFDDGGALVVDDTFDVATADAVLAWWQSIDPAINVAPADLVVPAGSFVVVPSELTVGEALVAEDTQLVGDAAVLRLTSPARVVSTTAPIDDDTFALGATIDVEFPDGTVEPGTVVDVGTVATNSTGNPGDTPSVEIDIRVDDIPDSVDRFVSIPVTLRVVSDDIQDAFVVPVSALVALAEGGYALEEVTGTNPDGSTATKLIAVETGLFSNGFVVVTGDALSAGLEVVVPS
jgi:peptidoglycan hydrolase-like protein with peptidoglycan-binding domain